MGPTLETGQAAPKLWSSLPNHNCIAFLKTALGAKEVEPRTPGELWSIASNSSHNLVTLQVHVISQKFLQIQIYASWYIFAYFDHKLFILRYLIKIENSGKFSKSFPMPLTLKKPNQCQVILIRFFLELSILETLLLLMFVLLFIWIVINILFYLIWRYLKHSSPYILCKKQFSNSIGEIMTLKPYWSARFNNTTITYLDLHENRWQITSILLVGTWCPGRSKLLKVTLLVKRNKKLGPKLLEH